MKEIFTKIKVPLIVIVVLFVGFFIYNSFIKKPETKTTLNKSVQNPINDKLEKNIIPLLSKIKDINLDDKFFGDPTFKSLVDFGQIIVEEDKGRSDPFSPSSSKSATTTTLSGVSFETSTSSAPAKKGITPPKAPINKL